MPSVHKKAQVLISFPNRRLLKSAVLYGAFLRFVFWGRMGAAPAAIAAVQRRVSVPCFFLRVSLKHIKKKKKNQTWKCQLQCCGEG
jgi:hypothetical protein